jgi:hypothetical protein
VHDNSVLHYPSDWSSSPSVQVSGIFALTSLMRSEFPSAGMK